MEGIGFSDIVKYFFQYGPFAILPYLIGFELPRLHKQFKNASKDLKVILKRDIFVYRTLVLFLTILCVGFWTFTLLDSNSYYFGKIVNLDAKSHTVNSPQLHLKSYLIDNRYRVIAWIWKKEKGEKFVEITLVSKDPVSDSVREDTFFCSAEDLKQREKCIFEYKEEDAVLVYNDKSLPKTKPKYVLNPKSLSAVGVSFLYAAPPTEQELSIDKALEFLQAFESGIRNQAVDLILNEANKNPSKVELLLRRGFDMIYSPNMVQNHQVYNQNYLKVGLLELLVELSNQWCTEFARWKIILGDETLDRIVEEVVTGEQEVKSLALRYLWRFQKEIATDIAQKMNREEYKNRADYIRGAAEFYVQMPEQRSMLKEFRATHLDLNQPQIVAEIASRIEAQEFQLPGNIGGRRLKVLRTALELKKANIPYKYGGTNPRMGFDMTGFISYIFLKNEVIDLEEWKTWGAWELRTRKGKPRPEKKPKEPGDLLFYKGGYIMLYLGNSKMIGMTPDWIVINDYREFKGTLFQVNCIDYH